MDKIIGGFGKIECLSEFKIQDDCADGGAVVRLPFGEVAVPSDYDSFCRTFGSIIFNEFIIPINVRDGAEAETVMTRIIGNYKYFHTEFPQNHPFPPFPAKYSLIPWGITENGDELFWYKLSESPDEWQVLAWQSRSDKYWLYPMGAVEFLQRVSKGELHCPAFSGMKTMPSMRRRGPIQ